MSQLLDVKLSDLHLNPANPATRNPDQELINSIKSVGIRTPLLVKKNEKGYVIIAGERRFKSAIELKLTTVPVLVQDDMALDSDATSLMLVDNLHRKNMNMYEEYQVITRLLETLSVSEVAKKLNKTSNYVTRRIGLDNLVPAVIKGIQEGMQGLNERIVFILARLPKDVQKNVWEACTDEYTVGGKILLRFHRDEDGVEDLAKHYLSETFLTGDVKPEDAFRIAGDKLGKVAIEKVIEKTFNDKELIATTPVLTPEQTKTLRKTLKEMSEADQLSTSEYVSEGQFSKSSWRKATSEDNEKSIKDGVIVNGPQAGMMIQYIKLNPHAKKESKTKLSEKQIEKNRAERKEKIFSNKVERITMNGVFAALSLQALNKGITVDKKVVSHLLQQLPYGWKARTLRQFLTKEEYSKVPFGDAGERLEKLLIKMEPVQQILFVMLAQEVVNDHDGIAVLTGINIAGIRNEATKNIKAEEKKIADQKLAEKMKAESDRKAKAKREKK